MITEQELHEKYKDLVYHRIWKSLRPITDHPSDINDVAQRVWEKVHKYYHSYDPERASLSTWVATITDNTCHDWANEFYEIRDIEVTSPENHGEELDWVETLGADPYNTPEDWYSGQESLEKAYDLLTYKELEVFRALYMDCFSTEEVAEILGMSLSTVYTHAQKIRDKFEYHKKEDKNVIYGPAGNLGEGNHRTKVPDSPEDEGGSDLDWFSESCTGDWSWKPLGPGNQRLRGIDGTDLGLPLRSSGNTKIVG